MILGYLAKAHVVWECSCGPVFFTCIPTRSTRLSFIWKNSFGKFRVVTYFIFILKGKIKQKKKSLKKCDFIVKIKGYYLSLTCITNLTFEVKVSIIPLFNLLTCWISHKSLQIVGLESIHHKWWNLPLNIQ